MRAFIIFVILFSAEMVVSQEETRNDLLPLFHETVDDNTSPQIRTRLFNLLRKKLKQAGFSLTEEVLKTPIEKDESFPSENPRFQYIGTYQRGQETLYLIGNGEMNSNGKDVFGIEIKSSTIDRNKDPKYD